ncbi:hypothetical protein [Vibrio owensii]|uniref:hypothetical protein n=1 Tax=Vibrio owensii TaxID=696485 RepID=UPI0005979929|nr:hypothetical protein [Vibrio owensii]
MMKFSVVSLLVANLAFAGFNFYVLTQKKTDSPHTELVTHQLRVVDENNTTKLVLSADTNESTITALDDNGAIRYQFSLNGDGSYTMLFDNNEVPRVGYFVKDEDNQVVYFTDRVDDYTP